MKVELKSVGRAWGDQVALRSMDLTIERGERVALLGPSGSGKTTLLRLIAGALRPSRGHVLANGADLDQMSAGTLRAYRRRNALLSQTSHCVDELTVHANVVAGMVPSWPWYRVLASSFWSLESKEVAELLAALDLEDRQWDLAAVLSGGQRQRVAIARALAARSEMLLLDEPTSALDPETARQVLAAIAQRRTKKQTIVVSTHRAGEIRDHVDRVIGLLDGRVEFDCASSELGSSRLQELYNGSRELAV